MRWSCYICPINKEMHKTLPAHIAAGHITSARMGRIFRFSIYREASSKDEIDEGDNTLTDLSIEHPYYWKSTQQQ